MIGINGYMINYLQFFLDGYVININGYMINYVQFFLDSAKRVTMLLHYSSKWRQHLN